MAVHCHLQRPNLLNLNCDFMVISSQAKIDENFANYFLQPKLTIGAYLCTCSMYM